MGTIILETFTDFANGMIFGAAPSAATQAMSLINNPTVLVAGIILIAVTIFLLFFLKKIVVNSILGGVIWIISVVVFHVELPMIPSFVIAVIFGPAGIGAMLLLKFFGLLA